MTLSSTDVPGLGAMTIVIRRDVLYVKAAGRWARVPAPAGQASADPLAGFDLTKYVTNVRVDEGVLVDGEPMARITGVIDTSAALNGLLGTLGGTGAAGLGDASGVLGDIRAVLYVSETTHLPDEDAGRPADEGRRPEDRHAHGHRSDRRQQAGRHSVGRLAGRTAGGSILAALMSRRRDKPVRLTKIYTRGGDKGQTSLGDGSRVPKTDLRIAAYGTVDELNSFLGLALASPDLPDEFRPWLEQVQNDLFDVGADLSVPLADKRERLRVRQEQVDWLEELCDLVNERLEPLKSFVLPGGREAAARLHVARSGCRRAEREAVALSSAEE